MHISIVKINKSIFIHTMEKIQVIWSHVTLGSRKYSILSVFVCLSLAKAQRKNLYTIDNSGSSSPGMICTNGVKPRGYLVLMGNIVKK